MLAQGQRIVQPQQKQRDDGSLLLDAIQLLKAFYFVNRRARSLVIVALFLFFSLPFLVLSGNEEGGKKG